MKTNEQRLKNLIKENDPILNALLVERITKVAELTKKAIEENPTDFCTLFTNEKTYLSLIANIEKHFNN